MAVKSFLSENLSNDTAPQALGTSCVLARARLPQSGQPGEACVHGDRVYITDQLTGCIWVYGLAGLELVTSWPLPRNGSPRGIATLALTRDPSRAGQTPTDCEGEMSTVVCVSDFRNHCVVMFGLDGRVVRTIGSLGDGPGELTAPTGLASCHGFLFIGEAGNHRIQTLSPDGSFVRLWGREGDELGEFRSICGVAATEAYIYVVDSDSHRIQAFSVTGHFECAWGCEGDAPGQFNFPTSIAAEKHSGRLYVSDLCNGRIQVFGPRGEIFPAPVGLPVTAAVLRLDSLAFFAGVALEEPTPNASGKQFPDRGSLVVCNVCDGTIYKVSLDLALAEVGLNTYDTSIHH